MVVEGSGECANAQKQLSGGLLQSTAHHHLPPHTHAHTHADTELGPHRLLSDTLGYWGPFCSLAGIFSGDMSIMRKKWRACLQEFAYLKFFEGGLGWVGCEKTQGVKSEGKINIVV